MVHQQLSSGLASWSELIAPGDGPMSKALGYFVHREMSRGWVGWHSQWEARRARLASMRRSLAHLLNRELSRGLIAWVEMAVDRAEFLRKLRKGVSRLVSQQVSSGFVSWRVAVCARDDPMSTALRYLFNRALARGWLAWQETWAELTRARESLGRGPVSYTHLTLPTIYSV